MSKSNYENPKLQARIKLVKYAGDNLYKVYFSYRNEDNRRSYLGNDQIIERMARRLLFKPFEPHWSIAIFFDNQVQTYPQPKLRMYAKKQNGEIVIINPDRTARKWEQLTEQIEQMKRELE